MKHKITERQLMALLACYCGERPVNYGSVYGEAHEKAGQPVWYSRTNMGGAAHRMTEDLRERGFITEYNRYEDFGDKTSNDLTTLGYEAIEERIGKLPKVKNIYGEPTFDFSSYIKLDELQERKEARRKREAEQVCLRAEKQESVRQRNREIAQRQREQQIAKLRKLFGDHGLADNWSDNELLVFAHKVSLC